MPPESDEEKTEDPTPKKLEKAREEGNVAKSKDMSDTAVLLAGILALFFFRERTMNGLESMMRMHLDFARNPFPGINEIVPFFQHGLLEMANIMWPIFMVLVLVAVVINIAQIGLLWSSKSLAPKFNKLNPISGIKQKLSLKNFVELIKSMIKVFVLGPVAYFIARDEIDVIPKLFFVQPRETLAIMAWIIFKIWLVLVIIMAIVGLIDFVYQKWQHTEQLKMSKQEVKEENKQQEGNPEVKQKIRSLQREMVMKRMMQEVPKSDVVITNPVFIAIALRYDAEQFSAPFVTAKGQEIVAQRICDIARESQVPVHQDALLARQLYDALEVGDQITQELYQAVAEILAEIYRQKGAPDLG